MKQDSLSILFFILKGRLLKNGEAPIILRVTLNGQEDQMRVLRSVPMQLWNRAKGRSTGKDASSKELNNYLNGLQIRLLTIHKELSEREAHITLSLLLSKLFAKDEKHLLVASFKKHIDECTKLIGIDYEAVTINRYDNCARSLARFIATDCKKVTANRRIKAKINLKNNLPHIYPYAKLRIAQHLDLMTIAACFIRSISE